MNPHKLHAHLLVCAIFHPPNQPNIPLLSFPFKTSPLFKPRILFHRPTHSSISTFPNLANPPHILPANRTNIHLPRALLARNHMPAIIQQRIHLILVANLTQIHFFVRNLVPHHPLAVSSPLLPPAFVHIVRFAVYHLAVSFTLVVRPFTRVRVAGSVGHGAVTRSLAGDPIADVGVAVGVDHCALAVDVVI